MLTSLSMIIGIYCFARILEMVLGHISKPGRSGYDLTIAVFGAITLPIIFILTIGTVLSASRASSVLRGGLPY